MRQGSERPATDTRGRAAAARAIALAAACLALGACQVARLSVPAYPSAAQDATANTALRGHEAVVTSRSDAPEPVTVARFDADGNLAVGRPEDGAPEVAPRPLEWTSIPREDLVEVSTVDRGRGAIKGLVGGAIGGFVPVAIWTYSALGTQSCNTSAIYGANTACWSMPEGSLLLVSALFGLGAAIVTGGLGAALGAVVGDGADVRIVPDERQTASR